MRILFVEMFLPGVLRKTRRHGFSAADVEEVVSETFLCLLTQIARGNLNWITVTLPSPCHFIATSVVF
jgi:hypothetical protein